MIGDKTRDPACLPSAFCLLSGKGDRRLWDGSGRWPTPAANRRAVVGFGHFLLLAWLTPKTARNPAVHHVFTLPIARLALLLSRYQSCPVALCRATLLSLQER